MRCHELFNFLGLRSLYNWEITQLFIVFSWKVKTKIVEEKDILSLFILGLALVCILNLFHGGFALVIFQNIDKSMFKDIVSSVLTISIGLNCQAFGLGSLMVLHIFFFRATHDG